MKSKEDIEKHIEYLTLSTDHSDIKQLRELNIKMAELLWVLEGDLKNGRKEEKAKMED